MINGKNELSKIEKNFADKLAYEWRHLYRTLLLKDIDDTGLVDINEFDEECLRLNIQFINQDIKQLLDLYGEHTVEADHPKL